MKGRTRRVFWQFRTTIDEDVTVALGEYRPGDPSLTVFGIGAGSLAGGCRSIFRVTSMLLDFTNVYTSINIYV